MSDALPGAESWFRRCIPSLLGIVLLAAIATIYWAGLVHVYAYLLHVMGAYYSDTPFMDAQFELASIECTRQGIDVFVSDPCDVLGRTFNYSPIWLLGSHLPLHPSQTLAFGLGLDVLFLLSLALLPAPRNWWGTLIVIAATLSNSVFVALEQANADLVIFLLLLLAGIAALRPPPLRFLAYPLIVAAGLLKFYPVVAMGVAVRERPARFLGAAVFALVCFAVFIYADGPDIARAMHLVPSGHYLSMFGAKVLPYGLRILYPRAYAMLPVPQPILLLLFSILCVALAIVIATRRQTGEAISRLTAPERVFLLIGSLVMVGCFFAGDNFRYRNVFFLFILPAMTTICWARSGRLVTCLAAASSLGIVFLMWGYYLARLLESVLALTLHASPLGRLLAAAFWLAHQLLWWWIVSVLLAAILLVAAGSPAVQHSMNYRHRPRG